MLDVNLKGSFLTGQAVARHMVERVKAGEKPGAIVNMSSVNAVFAIANQVPYSVSKGGINQLTKVMALSLAPYGIRVNAIGPGSIMTEMLAWVNADRRQKTGSCRARRSAASANRPKSPRSPHFWPPTRRATSPAKPSMPMAAACP